ncbi:hypothetical protein ABK736_00450 [Klebsiella aerogenes]|nr:hypothetical protein [Klebsiella aerogenes]
MAIRRQMMTCLRIFYRKIIIRRGLASRRLNKITIHRAKFNQIQIMFITEDVIGGIDHFTDQAANRDRRTGLAPDSMDQYCVRLRGNINIIVDNFLDIDSLRAQNILTHLIKKSITFVVEKSICRQQHNDNCRG